MSRSLQTSRFLRQLWTATLGIVWLASVSYAEAPVQDRLEDGLQQAAKQALQKLRERQLHSVGVLKFSIRTGSGPFPTSLGTLNHRLAEKLELALVLANPAQESKAAQQVGVIRNASDTAATIPGAQHVTPEGQSLLFSKEYPLAWAINRKSAVIPDAFIIGVAQVRDDLRAIDIELSLLENGKAGLEPFHSQTSPLDLEDLIDSGESFTTRGLFDGGQVNDGSKVVELVAKRSQTIRDETFGKSQPQPAKAHPLAGSNEAPLSLEVWYGNRKQNIEFRDGAAFVHEPSQGEKVMFIVRRTVNETTRYGIVLRVNGENTLYRERLPDSRASIWIMEPTMKEFSVQGFQLDNGTRQDFRVLSDSESRKRAIDYGRDVGMISFTVFQTGNAPVPSFSDDELDLAIQSKAKLPTQTASSRGQLGRSLTDQLLAQDITRGLIVEGEKTNAAVKTTTFQRDPIPVMATSIRYYK